MNELNRLYDVKELQKSILHVCLSVCACKDVVVDVVVFSAPLEAKWLAIYRKQNRATQH